MKLNIVFLLNIPFPKGMAGTKRIQHTIDALTTQGAISTVIITRQSTTLNKSNGRYKGIPYTTILPNLLGWKLAFKLPLLIVKTIIEIRKNHRANHQNILFVYHFPSIDNIIAIVTAQMMGYKIVFDIVEDAEFGKEIATNWQHLIMLFFKQKLTNNMPKIADGVIIISSYLKNRYHEMGQGRLPLHVKPISIDITKFSKLPNAFNKQQVTLLYSGSFGVKDGISNLLDAFDILATKHPRLEMIMTGKGADQRIKEVKQRIENSPAKNRIDYRGYVDENEYYNILSTVDIPCMTRINSGYANAGFPFKLGEFLASGKPVLASDVSDVGAILKDRHSAMLVAPDDVQSIVAAIEYLISNPQKAIEIGERGQKCAIALFDYRSHGMALHKFLYSL